jgi:pimeloyl-ACP methyl ester carboxylesterase
MFGRWLLPAFKDSHYSIALDYPCDTGRSVPPEGDPSKCPSTEEEIAAWVAQVISQLGVAAPASLVGYSYGSLVAFLTARHEPRLVDRLVLLAQPMIFGENISPSFLWRGLVFQLFRSDERLNWLFRWLSTDPNFDLLQLPGNWYELFTATNRVGASTLSVPPGSSYDVSVVGKVARRHRTFVGLGERDALVKNVSAAIDNARQAGAEVHVYPDAGHLLLFESEASDRITSDVVEFLNS